jgi:hypothetical protein
MGKDVENDDEDDYSIDVDDAPRIILTLSSAHPA